jgi:hypothetical protein
METGIFFAIKDKCLAFIESRLTWPFNVPAERWEEKDFCLEAIALNKNALRLVPRRFRRDAAFCRDAVIGFCA